MIRNTAIAKKTGFPSVTAVIDAGRTAIFGHVATFDNRVPTQSTLRLAIDVRLGMPLSPSWKGPHGHPHDTWLKPFLHSNISIKERWDAAVGHGHGASAQRS